MEDHIVEMLGVGANEDTQYEKLINPSTGVYNIPVPFWRFDEFTKAMKGLQSWQTATSSHLTRWAVLDTGMMLSHPLIQSLLEQSKDFTTEKRGRG